MRQARLQYNCQALNGQKKEKERDQEVLTLDLDLNAASGRDQ